MNRSFDLCPDCDPGLRGPDVKAGEHHIAVRFGDMGREWRVLLDGADVGDRSDESWAGPDGWVRLLVDEDGQAHICARCGQDVARQIAHGDVEISYIPSRNPHY